MFLLPVEELKILMADRPGWCVSLFMPTHRSGEDTRQDPIRFDNLLRRAESELVKNGMRTVDARALLEPAFRLEGHSPFWRHMSDGLAVYLGRDLFRYYTLPLPLEEQLIVAQHVYVKPLLPLLSGDGHFYVLALSQNQVRIFQGSRYTVGELDLEGMPGSLSELLGDEPRQKQLQYHSRTDGGIGRRPAMYFGHGEEGDQARQDILRYFKAIDTQLNALLVNDQAPLVLAGVDYLLPLYRSVSSHPHVVEEGIQGNPEQLSAQVLHESAWKIVQPHFQTDLQDALALFHALEGGSRTEENLQEIVQSAFHGRVKVLFVTLGEQVWGQFDPQSSSTIISEEQKPGDEDMLQFACNHTIINGGTVYTLDVGDLPGSGTLAAILRY